MGPHVRPIPSEELARLASELRSWTLELARVQGTLEGVASALAYPAVRVSAADVQRLAEGLADLRQRIAVVRDWSAAHVCRQPAEAAAALEDRAGASISARGVPVVPPSRATLEAARDEAAERNARDFGTDPSWYGRPRR